MPYGEKLILIKKEKRLTNAAISKMCNVPLATITRLFDEKNLSGNFETFVLIAKGLEISLDELAGLKPPSQSPCAELLEERNKKIERLTEDIQTFREDNKHLREDNKHLREDNKALRREKFKIVGILIALLVAFVIYIMFTLLRKR